MATVTIYPTSDYAETNSAYIGVSPATPTTRYVKVNEVVADDNASYISSNTSNQCGVDFGMGDIALPTGTVSSVTIFMRIQAIITSGSNKFIYFKPRINQVNYPAFTAKAAVPVGGNNWENFYFTYTTNPSTGVSWTWDDINAMKVGFLWYATDTKMFGYLTQMNAIITYTEPPPGIQFNGATISKLNGATISKLNGAI